MNDRTDLHKKTVQNGHVHFIFMPRGKSKGLWYFAWTLIAAACTFEKQAHYFAIYPPDLRIKKRSSTII